MNTKKLPACSGIYIAELGGEVLYIGKAENLKNDGVNIIAKLNL